MPFVNLYLRKGITQAQARRCVHGVTAAIADNLEHTLPRMVRICIYEIPSAYMAVGGEAPDGPAPTLVLQLGPGRSREAVARCLAAVTTAVSAALEIPRETVRFYVEQVPGSHFAIGGKPKNFAGKEEV